MSDETIAIENKEVRHRSKLLMLAVLLLSIAAVISPILIERILLYDEYGYSKNGTLTHLVMPGIWSAIILLVIALIVWTRVSGDMDVVWYRWNRSEVIKAILLIISVLLVWSLLNFLIRRLGLPLNEDLYFWADQRGLAFFITLTVFAVIITPILEELFWRVYVFGTLRYVFGGLIAWLLQAVLFAVVHFRPVGGFFPVFSLGLIAGAWRWRRRTLVPVILAHIAVNSLWCAAQWPDWLDFARVRTTHDYVTEFIELSKPAGYDPNDDARREYAKAGQLVIELPEELKEVRKRYPTQWSKDERAQADAWVASNKEALELVEKGTRKPYYRIEYDHDGDLMLSLLERDIDRIKHFAFALCLRAKLQTTQGRYEQGFNDVETCYKLGRHLAPSKGLLPQLVAYAVCSSAVNTGRMIVAYEDINPVLLIRLQRKLETFAKDIETGYDFTETRFIYMDVIQRIFTDDGHSGGHIPRSAFKKKILPDGEFESEIGLLASVAESDTRAWRKLERRITTAEVNRYYNLSEKACLVSPWQYNRNVDRIKTTIEKIEERNPLIKTFSPAIDRLGEIAARSRANLDALIATLAILRYKVDTQQLPHNLSELVATGYLETVPDDPFSGGSITYKLTDEGFILYSFGADFDDDGGTPSKWGYGEKGGDQVFWPVQESTANSESIAETKSR